MSEPERPSALRRPRPHPAEPDEPATPQPPSAPAAPARRVPMVSFSTRLPLDLQERLDAYVAADRQLTVQSVTGQALREFLDRQHA